MSSLTGYSLEMTARDRPALDLAAPSIAPGTQIAVTFLPGEDMDSRIAAAVHIRQLGFEPMLHISARRLKNSGELSRMIERAGSEAQVDRVFLVAGDPPVPEGPFEDVLSMLATGIFEANGVTSVGIAGHPEGHAAMDQSKLEYFMDRKLQDIGERGMKSLIVTQFGFDPDAFISWLVYLRNHGVEAPVRLGIPGPAGVKRLLRYAAFCGVGASTAVLRKYGISLGRLMAPAGPDRLVEALLSANVMSHQPLNFHFYPFGGLEATVSWINAQAERKTG